jgi:hypothetical protein
MPLVKVLKPMGFEQVGDVVTYMGANLDQLLEDGTVELAFPYVEGEIVEDTTTPVVPPEVVSTPVAEVVKKTPVTTEVVSTPLAEAVEEVESDAEGA